MIASRVSHILVPIDFSCSSQAALSYAKMLAANFGASLHLLRVLDDVMTPDAVTIDPYKRHVGADEACALDEGSRLCNLLSGDEVKRFQATAALVFGSLTGSIAEYAREHGIDLIVMGTNECTPLGSPALGSVAECVARAAQCPVLTVRGFGAAKVHRLECAHRVALAATEG
jgi:universal stress protein A